MKTTFFIALPLLIAGLLLNGCSGLDDPDDPGEENPSAYEGSYLFFTNTDVGECTIPPGIVMQISSEGDISSNPKIDRNTGETIKLNGRVGSSGTVRGEFNFSFPGHSGDYDGVLNTIECDRDEEGFITGKTVSGRGEWIDYQSGVSDCDGSWFVCVVNTTTRN